MSISSQAKIVNVCYKINNKISDMTSLVHVFFFVMNDSSALKMGLYYTFYGVWASKTTASTSCLSFQQ